MGNTIEAKPGQSKVRFIPLTYNQAESQTSSLRLILALRPEWEHNGKIEFIRFTDGITNTLLKVVNKRPGLSAEDLDNEAVLLRAYGKGTDLIIDRERETQNHELLMQYGLAPALLARFHNGMLYRFIRGAVTSPADLRKQEIWRAVAKRLAEWHAVVPCLPSSSEPVASETNGDHELGLTGSNRKSPAVQALINNAAPGKPAPNVWTVMQKWIFALPVGTPAEKQRQEDLQKELTRLVEEFSNRPGLGENAVSNGALQSHPSRLPCGLSMCCETLKIAEVMLMPTNKIKSILYSFDKIHYVFTKFYVLGMLARLSSFLLMSVGIKITKLSTKFAMISVKRLAHLLTIAACFRSLRFAKWKCYCTTTGRRLGNRCNRNRQFH